MKRVGSNKEQNNTTMSLVGGQNEETGRVVPDGRVRKKSNKEEPKVPTSRSASPPPSTSRCGQRQRRQREPVSKKRVNDTCGDKPVELINVDSDDDDDEHYDNSKRYINATGTPAAAVYCGFTWPSEITISFQPQLPELNSLNMAKINVAAEKILKFAVYWTNAFGEKYATSPAIRAELIRSCWTDLFIIAFVQFPTDDLSDMCLSNSMTYRFNCNSEKKVDRNGNLKLSSALKTLLTVCHNLRVMQLDEDDFGSLRLLALSSPERVAFFGPYFVEVVSACQNTILKHLHASCIPVDISDPVLSKQAEKATNERLLKLLMIMPQLRSITAKEIQAIFFRNIGKEGLEALITQYLGTPVPDAKNFCLVALTSLAYGA